MQTFWKDLLGWYQQYSKEKTSINLRTIVLGWRTVDPPILDNYILLSAKSLIYELKISCTLPTLEHFKKVLISFFLVERFCFLRWLDIVFILCARAPLLDLWGVKRILFSHAQLQNPDFVNLSAIFLPLFLQFPSVNFFKIWQLGKTRFQFDDERFKFTNQKLQYFLTMKTTYFNITGKLARSPPFFLS